MRVELQPEGFSVGSFDPKILHLHPATTGAPPYWLAVASFSPAIASCPWFVFHHYLVITSHLHIHH
jgi:hypothetical protein